jgi:alpha-beta hydrolase superfamily lysophospholipase
MCCIKPEKEAAHMRIDNVEFLCDIGLFKGKLYLPDDLDKCKGVVIFTHGLGYCTRSYTVKGEYFVANNYIMLSYNLRGHAGTVGKWTINNSVEDLRRGIDYIEMNYDFKNKHNIGVLGHSTGALITMLAAIRDSRIKFGSIVTIVTSLTDSYIYWFKSGYNKTVKEYFKIKGAVSPIIAKCLAYNCLDDFRCGRLEEDALKIPHRYGMLKSGAFRDFIYEIAYSPNIIDEVDKIKIPLLLFRGLDDEIMPVEKTDELYAKLCIPQKKLIKTNSRNHFHNDCWEMIQQETVKFFDQIIKENSLLPLSEDKRNG